MAVASAGPYANNLHLAPDTNASSLNFYRSDVLPDSLSPNQQCQSTEGITINKIVYKMFGAVSNDLQCIYTMYVYTWAYILSKIWLLIVEISLLRDMVKQTVLLCQMLR